MVRSRMSFLQSYGLYLQDRLDDMGASLEPMGDWLGQALDSTQDRLESFSREDVCRTLSSVEYSLKSNTLSNAVEAITDVVTPLIPRGFMDGECLQYIRDTGIPRDLAERLRQLTLASQFVRGSVGTAAWMCASFTGQAFDQLLEATGQKGNEGHELGSIVVFWTPIAGNTWKVSVALISTRCSLEEKLAQSAGRITRQACGEDIGECFLSACLAAAEGNRVRKALQALQEGHMIHGSWSYARVAKLVCSQPPFQECETVLTEVARVADNLSDTRQIATDRLGMFVPEDEAIVNHRRRHTVDPRPHAD